MCGRFNVDFEENKELKKILHELNKKYPGNDIKHGEVFPTEKAAILIGGEKQVEPELSIWGFPGYQGKGNIINARSETASEKMSFREALVMRRCIIPMSGFYEWDKEKNKYYFKDTADTLYVAGLYNIYKGSNHFVILTRQANESMEEVHNRMPVIIKDTDIDYWIMEKEKTNALLQKDPGSLMKLRVS